VLIATEGEKAIDVFHITSASGAKLSREQQEAVTADLQQMLEGPISPSERRGRESPSSALESGESQGSEAG